MPVPSIFPLELNDVCRWPPEAGAALPWAAPWGPTSFLRIQHQRTGAWLQCPLTVGQAAQMPSGRIARSLHVHGSRVLPLRVTTPLPDGDVFAMVTPKGSPDVAHRAVRGMRRDPAVARPIPGLLR